MSFWRPPIAQPRGPVTAPWGTNPSIKAQEYGAAIPFVMGTARVKGQVVYAGPILGKKDMTIWNGQRWLGGTWAIRDVVYAICEAPVADVPTVYRPGLSAGGTYLTNLYSMYFYDGVNVPEVIIADSGVTAWARYSGNAAGMGHQGTVHVRYPNCYCGTDGTPFDCEFEVEGWGAGANGESSTGDAHPADMLTYLLTNAKNGLGLAAAFVEVENGMSGTAADSYRRYCSARGWYMSLCVQDRVAVTELIGQLLRATDSELVLIDGKLTAIPYADQTFTRSTFTYTPSTTPIVIDQLEMVHEEADPPVEVDRRQECEIFGVWPVTYCSRDPSGSGSVGNIYKAMTREYIDPVWTSQYGARRADVGENDFSKWVMTADQAGWLTHAQAQRAIYQRNRYRFRLGPRWSLLTPMDYLSISDPLLSFSSLTVRVIATEEQEGGGILIETVEWPSNTANPIDLTPQVADGLQASHRAWVPAAPWDLTSRKVGGGNLLANSRIYDVAGGYAPFSKDTSADTAAGQTSGAPDGGTFQRLSWTATNAKHGWRPNVASLLRLNTDYVLSFYARSDVATTGCEVLGDVNPTSVEELANPALTSAWQRYAFLVRWESSLPSTYAIFRTAAIIAAAGYLDVACVQLEEGGVATGYQPKGGEILPGMVGRDQGTASNVDKDNLWPNPTSEIAPPPGADLTSPEWEGRTNAGAGAYSGSWVRQFAHGVLKGFWVPCAPGARFYEEAMVKKTSGSATAGAMLEIAFFGDSVGGDPSRTALARHDSPTSVSETWAQLRVTSAAAPAGTVAAFIGVVGQDTNDYQWDALYSRRIDVVLGHATGGTNWTLLQDVAYRSGGSVSLVLHGRASTGANWGLTLAQLPAGFMPAVDHYKVFGTVYRASTAQEYPALFVVYTDGSVVVASYFLAGVQTAMWTAAANDWYEFNVTYVVP